MPPLRPAFWRAALMRKPGDLSTRDVPGIARTETRDTGQVISQTGRQLVPRAADNFHYFAEMCTWKAAPCLAFGNSAVLKLSELSLPPSSLRSLPPRRGA